jgi:hypothetical protein
MSLNNSTPELTDALLIALARISDEVRATGTLSDEHATLIFLCFGPMAVELLHHRRMTRGPVTPAPNVVALHRQEG